MKFASGKITVKVNKPYTTVQKRFQWFSATFLIFSVVLLHYYVFTTDYVLIRLCKQGFFEPKGV